MSLMAVHKFEIPPYNMSTVQLPVGSTIRHIGTQGDSQHYEKAYLWAEVPLDSQAKEIRQFRVIGTGDPFELDYEDHTEALDFIGTVQFRHTQLVFHVYEIFKLAL